MKRKVIKIDEGLCNGCGACVTGCHEGALQLIDGKAVMISDLYCDGLGACIGDCPVGAISFEEREALPYDEITVMEKLVPKGRATVIAHLAHLKAHGEMEWFEQGAAYLKANDIDMDISELVEDDKRRSAISAATVATPNHKAETPEACGCPGSAARVLRPVFANADNNNHNHQKNGMVQSQSQPSQLSHFPVQLHLINPMNGCFAGADMLLAADCTAFACGDFHSRFLRGKALCIACPKLDSNTAIYVDKLAALIDTANIDTLTVLIMEVPCCGGLVRIAEAAREKADRNIPLKIIRLSVGGETLENRWV